MLHVYLGAFCLLCVCVALVVLSRSQSKVSGSGKASLGPARGVMAPLGKPATKPSAKKRHRKKKTAGTGAQQSPAAEAEALPEEVSAYVDETEFASTDDSECKTAVQEEEDRPLVLSGGYVGEDVDPVGAAGAYSTVVVGSSLAEGCDLRQAGHLSHFTDDGFSYTEGSGEGRPLMEEGRFSSTGIFESMYGTDCVCMAGWLACTLHTLPVTLLCLPFASLLPPNSRCLHLPTVVLGMAPCSSRFEASDVLQDSPRRSRPTTLARMAPTPTHPPHTMLTWATWPWTTT